MNNVTYDTEKEALAAVSGPVDLVACDKCGVVFNAVFDPSILNYDQNYDNSRSSSKAYLGYIDELTSKTAVGLSSETNVLEVGCGNGDFLQALCERSGASGFGYDTVYKGEEQVGAVLFYKKYFSADSSTRQYDALVLRHVIEHIGQPYDFLKKLCCPAVLRKGAKVVIETPDLQWIVGRGAFFDVTYEHCNYYTKESLSSLLAFLGFEDIQVEKVFGEQYLLLQAIYLGESFSLSDRSSVDVEMFEKGLKDAKQKFSDIVRAAETVCIWGASGKGVLFLNSFDDDLMGRFDHVVDINQNKQGRYLPVCGKRVEPPEALKQVPGIVDVIIMNEVYQQEIETMLKDMEIEFRSHVC